MPVIQVGSTSCGAELCVEKPECIVCGEGPQTVREYGAVDGDETGRAPAVVYHFSRDTVDVRGALSSRLHDDYCADQRHRCSYMCERCWLRIVTGEYNNDRCPMCRGVLREPPGLQALNVSHVWSEEYNAGDFRVNVDPSSYGPRTRWVLGQLNTAFEELILRITGKHSLTDFRSYFNPLLRLYVNGLERWGGAAGGYANSVSVHAVFDGYAEDGFGFGDSRVVRNGVKYVEEVSFGNGGGEYGIVPVVPLVHVTVGQSLYLDPDYHMPFRVADGNALMFDCNAICSFRDDEDDPHNEGRQFLAHFLQIVRAFQDDVQYPNEHSGDFDLFEDSSLAVATREHYPGGSVLLV